MNMKVWFENPDGSRFSRNIDVPEMKNGSVPIAIRCDWNAPFANEFFGVPPSECVRIDCKDATLHIQWNAGEVKVEGKG